MLSHLVDVFLILAPLFVGFLFPMRKDWMRSLQNFLINASVYIILFVMGYGIAHIDNLGSGMVAIFKNAVVYWILICGLNIIVVGFWDRMRPWKDHEPKESSDGALGKILASLKLLLFVAAGVVVGLFLPKGLIDQNKAVTILLTMLLFLVGSQLRSSGISLRQVFLNRRGMLLVLWFVASAWIAGVVAALILDVPLAKSLAISSGFGWYSLSGSIITQAYGPLWGAVALLNDLAREMTAMMLIPVLMRRYPSAAVSLGGATSLDFALPTIIKAGGTNAMLMSISFSFIVNVISPVLMILFAALDS